MTCRFFLNGEPPGWAGRMGSHQPGSLKPALHGTASLLLPLPDLPVPGLPGWYKMYSITEEIRIITYILLYCLQLYYNM
jgi:hypothetical protein